MIEELIEKLLTENGKEENDECLSKSSRSPGATIIVFIFPVDPATNLLLRAPNILEWESYVNCDVFFSFWLTLC